MWYALESRDQHCSTRNETRTPGARQLWNTCHNRTVEQIIIALSTIPLQLCDEYSTPYDSRDLQKVQEMLCSDTVNDEDKDIVNSQKNG